jgi:Polyketide synthase dehydratase
MGVEAFAESALSMLPGWHIEALEDVNFLAPFKFYRKEPRTLAVQAVFRAQGDRVVADCKLIGRRSLPNQAEPQVTTHFTARVRLARQPLETVTVQAPGAPAGPVVEAADIYRVYFHGPAYQVVERAWLDGQRIVGQMARSLPAHHQPPELPLAMAPRLIELCFQTAGLWEMSTRGRMGLPLHIDRVSVWRAPELAEGPLHAVVTPDSDGESYAAEVVDAAGTRYAQLAGYRTVALPGVVDFEPLKILHAVMA